MVLPQQSQTYNPSQYEDICTGTYVTRTTTAGTVRGVLVREPGGGAAPDTLPHPMAGTVEGDAWVDDGGCVSAPITVYVRAGEVVTVRVECGSSIG